MKASCTTKHPLLAQETVTTRRKDVRNEMYHYFCGQTVRCRTGDRLAGLPGGDHREKKFCLCFPRSLPESKRYFALLLKTGLTRRTHIAFANHEKSVVLLPETSKDYRCLPCPAKSFVQRLGLDSIPLSHPILSQTGPQTLYC